MKRAMIRPSIVWLAAAVLFLAVVFATHAEEQEQSQESEAAEAGVEDDVARELAERRSAMLKDAHAALDETNAALKALGEGRNDDALEALARATGKLELIVARDPGLALAPIDVDYVTYDLYATPEGIRAAREDAEELLKEGKVQQARALLSGLASEIVIRVKNLPLATYPDAIKAVSPLIDAGKTDEAMAALRASLNTLVVTDHVISLPVLRARHLLDEAERLAEGDEADAEKGKVGDLVKGARKQLEIAELLGYGDEQEHESFRRQIAELEKKFEGKEETRGVFAKLRKSLNGFETSFFE